MSFAAVQDSPVLQRLVFTWPSSTLYTHTTHRLFPLKTTSQASAELTEISSMVSGEDRDRMMTTPRSTPAADSQFTSASNSPLTSREKGRGRHGTPGSLRNGLTSSLLPPSPSSPSSSPSSTSPSPFSVPCQDNPSYALSPIKLSSLNKYTSIASSNDHTNSSVESYKCSGEVAGDPCNHTTNELINRDQDEKPRVHSVTSAGGGGRDLVCMPTYMPKFLLAYTPSVSLLTSNIMCCTVIYGYCMCIYTCIYIYVLCYFALLFV